MSAKQFTKSMEAGEAWTYELMNEFVAKMKADKKRNQLRVAKRKHGGR